MWWDASKQEKRELRYAKCGRAGIWRRYKSAGNH